MVPLNKDELALLYIMKVKSLTIKALKLHAKKITLFSRHFMPHLDLLWSKYMLAILQNKNSGKGITPSKDIVIADCMEAVEGSDFTSDLKERAKDILSRYREESTEQEEMEGLELLERLVTLDAQRKLSLQISGNSDLLALRKSIDNANLIMQDIKGPILQPTKTVVQPLAIMDKLLVRKERIPTGVDYLDIASGGGGRAGELWLIIGGSGSGKTQLTTQYNIAQAYLGNYTMHATYEQTIDDGDLSARMIANITGCGISNIRDRG